MKALEGMKKIKVAAVQVESKHGAIEANHKHALPYIEEAARAGAQLVILPELFPTGYLPNESLWDFAEPKEGPTVSWIKRTAEELGIYLGAGLVETDGRDFFNIFVLAGPGGNILGRVTKNEAESYIFKRSSGSHVIQTPFGKIGVGICADNQFAAFLKQMREEAVDLMLMPHGWPTPCKTNEQVSQQDIQKVHENAKQLVLLYAKSLGVPAIFINGVGPMGRMIGLLGKFMDPTVFRLEGRSRIIDSDGMLVGELESEEGVTIADVTMDPSRKCYVEPENYDGWLLPGNAISRKVIVPFDVTFGQIWYSLNPQRRQKAQAVAARAAIV
jgi:N-carbamoylputrescine amidase